MEQASCDILIRNCILMAPTFELIPNQAVAIRDTRFVEIGDSDAISYKYEAAKAIDATGKVLMPGLVDSHTHMCQHFLRSRTLDEYPMVWTRFLVPYESTLSPEDVYFSAVAGCIEMIKSGITAFADAGGVHMGQVAKAVIDCGLRAVITKSTMDTNSIVHGAMKESAEEAIENNEELYEQYHGKGDDRVHIWFGLRETMAVSPKLARMIGDHARARKTGIHAHLCEHKDEVKYCLEKYRLRPVAWLEEMGVLGPNLLAAHSVALNDDDIEMYAKHDVKVGSCPRAALSCMFFPKTPQLRKAGVTIALGSDGASTANLNLWDEMKVWRSSMQAYWGFPNNDFLVMPADQLLRYPTINGAKAILQEKDLGTIEVGKKADAILVDIRQPHMRPTKNLLRSLAVSADAHDVTHTIANGKLLMIDRVLLGIDEHAIMDECERRMDAIFKRAGI